MGQIENKLQDTNINWDILTIRSNVNDLNTPIKSQIGYKSKIKQYAAQREPLLYRHMNRLKRKRWENTY